MSIKVVKIAKKRAYLLTYGQVGKENEPRSDDEKSVRSYEWRLEKWGEKGDVLAVWIHEC